MKTLQEFQAFFERELRPKLAGMQTGREATRPHFWRVWRWLLLGALVASVTVIILLNAGAMPDTPWVSRTMPLLWGAVLVGFPVVQGIRIHFWRKRHGGAEKHATLVPAIQFLVPEFAYHPTQHIGPAKLRASRLFEMRGKLGAVSGDDHFSGRIGDTAVEFSEVRVTTSRTVREKNTTKTEHSTVTGLFLVAEFNKPFQHETLVLPDFRERILGTELGAWVGGAIDFINEAERTIREATGSRPTSNTPTAGQLGWQTVRLEDREFERQFRVFCTDPVEAHYILTPNVMEKLAAFQARVRFPVSFSFIGTAMHVFIPAGALFEGNLDADVSQFATYQAYYEQLHVVFDLVEVMQLNTRLWTKA